MKRLFFLLMIITSIAMAEEYNNAKDEFGFAIGPNIGWGLSYKHNLYENVSVRVTAGYFHDTQTSYNLGVEVDYSLKRNKYIDFFLSIGAIHTYEEKNFDYDYDNDNYDDGGSAGEHDTRGAIGIGFSSYFWELLSVSLEFHEVFEYSSLKSLTSKYEDKDKSEFSIYPMVGLTVGFLF